MIGRLHNRNAVGELVRSSLTEIPCPRNILADDVAHACHHVLSSCQTIPEVIVMVGVGSSQ
jgi:hypothetical protein